jgi:hypothetical protein
MRTGKILLPKFDNTRKTVPTTIAIDKHLKITFPITCNCVENCRVLEQVASPRIEEN